MRDGYKKRFHRLAAQGPPRTVGHGSRNHEWNSLACFFENLRDGKERRLCVERVENRFDDQKIDISLQQSLCLIEVCLAELIKTDSAKTRIVYVR